jgi:xanthosine utilization system XapX-like protein
MWLELDHQALLRGVVVAAAVAVPAGVLNALLDGEGAVAFVLVLVVLGGLVAGAVTAAGAQRVGAPLTHGILAAVTVYVTVQAIGVVRRLLAGDDLTWSLYLSSLVLSVFAGTLGGLIGARRASRAMEVD